MTASGSRDLIRRWTCSGLSSGTTCRASVIISLSVFIGLMLPPFRSIENPGTAVRRAASLDQTRVRELKHASGKKDVRLPMGIAQFRPRWGRRDYVSVGGSLSPLIGTAYSS